MGAFNQFNFEPSSAKYLAFEIDSNLVLILFTGMFGWQGSPAVWAVFSRALLRAAEGRLRGFIVVYVDDFIGINDVFNARNDQENLRSIVFGVFGREAINTDKSVSPSQIVDCIGWTVDLVKGVIFPNEKGRRKLVAAFFSFDLYGAISQRAFEGMASLASRYSMALLGTRPFVSALYAATVHDAPKHASSETRACIVVWRAIALMAISDPMSLAIPLRWVSSKSAAPDFYPTSDAGPFGLGVVIRDPTGVTVAFVSFRLPFSITIGESRYQNFREFLGSILSILMCYMITGGPCCIHWTSDNTTALSWVERDRAKGKSAQFAFLAYTWLVLLSGVHIVSASHIPGSTMGCVDKLSRFHPTPELASTADWSNKIPVNALNDLFMSCDPLAADQVNLSNWEVIMPSIISKVMKCLDR